MSQVAKVVGLLKDKNNINTTKQILNIYHLKSVMNEFYPGFILMRPKCKVAFKSVVRILLSRSFSPIETPPVVTTTSAELKLFCNASNSAWGLEKKKGEMENCAVFALIKQHILHHLLISSDAHINRRVSMLLQ